MPSEKQTSVIKQKPVILVEAGRKKQRKRSQIAEELEEKILQLYWTYGIKPYRIAKELNIVYSTVWRIINRKR